MRVFIKSFLIASQFCFVLVFNTGPVRAQEKINLYLGIGAPELYNVGLRFQLKQTQLGISYGTIFGIDDQIFSISSDVYFHFGGASMLSDRRPWYMRTGIDYLREENSTYIRKYTYLPIRIGRDFNLSKIIGIQIDLGAIIELSEKETKKKPSTSFWNFDMNDSILPALSIGFFIRI